MDRFYLCVQADSFRSTLNYVVPREEAVVGRRRRRTPEAAQAEIIEAAERLLHERPFRELTVDEVMRRTGLSRPSFYVYFKDRHDLVLRVVEHVGAQLLETAADAWLGDAAAGPDGIRKGFADAVPVYGEHAAPLRALADAAVDDRDVERAYSALVESFIERTAERIGDGKAAGTIAPAIDAHETAKALMWMTERYLYHSYGNERRVPPDRIIDTLSTIWTRVLYQS